jgi:hypothetical protein
MLLEENSIKAIIIVPTIEQMVIATCLLLQLLLSIADRSIAP